MDDYILITKNHSEAITENNILTTAWAKLGVPEAGGSFTNPKVLGDLKLIQLSYSCISQKTSFLSLRRNRVVLF